MSTANTTKEASPLFSFGVIADLQYADIDDGWDFHHTRARHYRNTLNILAEARKSWLQAKSDPTLKFVFVAQLGDLLDGKAKQGGKSKQSLDLVLEGFKDFKCYHLIGNHELYNFSREDVTAFLNATPEGKSYYSFKPFPGWQFVILDPYEISMMNKDNADALAYLKTRNPNDLTTNKNDWTQGLKGLNRRFLPYNGGVSKNQLSWLNDTLLSAASIKEKVIVLTHVPIGPGSCDDNCLVWNYDEILEVFHKYSCVKAVFAGHDHDGGYVQDAKGIHYVTFESPMQAPLGSNAFATVKVFDSKIIIHGEGTVQTRNLDLK